MPRQVAQVLQHAGARQVVGCRHHYQRRIFQVPRDQAGIRLRAHADGHVIAFVDEIDIAVAQVDVHPHLRIAATELWQQRQYPVVPIGGGNADAQGAGRRLLLPHQLALRFEHLVQRTPALLVVGEASFGQADAACGADEQAHPKPCLQARDRATHRRRCDARGQGGAGETADLCRQAEQLDAAQQHIIELTSH
ncbi:hypothetical protein D9M68_702910 [compost metagenome]